MQIAILCIISVSNMAFSIEGKYLQNLFKIMNFIQLSYKNGRVSFFSLKY